MGMNSSYGFRISKNKLTSLQWSPLQSSVHYILEMSLLSKSIIRVSGSSDVRFSTRQNQEELLRPEFLPVFHRNAASSSPFISILEPEEFTCVPPSGNKGVLFCLETSQGPITVRTMLFFGGLVRACHGREGERRLVSTL